MIAFWKTLAFRLLLTSFIVLALPLLVDSFVIMQKGYRDAIKDARGFLVETTYFRELAISELQPAKKPLLALLEYSLGLPDDFATLSVDKLNKELLDFADTGDNVAFFLTKMTQEGQALVIGSSTPGYEGKDFAPLLRYHDIFSATQEEKGYFNFFAYDPKTLEPLSIVGKAITDAADNAQGFLLIIQPVGAELKAVLAPDKIRYEVNFALLLANTLVFAASDSQLNFNYFSPIDLAHQELFLEPNPSTNVLIPKAPLQLSGHLDLPFMVFTWEGKEQVGYLKKIPNTDLSLLAYASKEAILVAPFQEFAKLYVAYLLILLIGGALAFILTYRMAKPFRRLTAVMQGVQKGELAARYVPDVLGFEINVLGDIFNETVDLLIEKKQSAEKERIARETYAQELLIGQKIQRSLFPEKMPEDPHVELKAVYISALEVGGDFYDVFTKKEGELVLVIADASGKGVSACFYSLGVRSMIRNYALAFDDLGRVITETNHLFCEDAGDSGMFVTLLAAIYDTKRHTLTYFSSGHNPLCLRKKGGEVQLLNHMGMALGLKEWEQRAKASQVTLEKGDLLVFYTDGITEAHNPSNQLFSEERFLEFLRRNGEEDVATLADHLVEEIKLFAAGAPQHDDITLLLMRVVE